MSNIAWRDLNLSRSGHYLTEHEIQNLPDNVQATLENMRQYYERALDDLNVNYNSVGEDYAEENRRANTLELERDDLQDKLDNLRCDYAASESQS